MPRVFLSHSSQDKLFVDRLASDLEKMTVDVWYDKWEIKVGDSIVEKIAKGLKENDYIALVLSPNSVQSDWVKREINSSFMREINEKKARILPLMYKHCEVPILLNERKWADFTKNYEDGFSEFITALFPEDNATVLRSKDFRLIQYLLAGLSTTDNKGENILNASQLLKVYKYKNSLPNYIQEEEKKLLFLSAIAFKHINTLTPEYLETYVPVWELNYYLSDKQKAQFILDSLDGCLIDYLIPYYEWAIEQLGVVDYNLLDALDPIVNHEFKFLYTDKKRSSKSIININIQKHIFNYFAKNKLSFFDNIDIINIERDSHSKETAAAIIESTALFKEPISEDYYLSFLNSPVEIALGAFKALIKLKNPKAVEFLIKQQELNIKDEPYNALDDNCYVKELINWYHKTKDLDTKVRLLVSLTNSGFVYDDEIIKTYSEVVKKDDAYRIPTILKLIGRLNDCKGLNIEKHLQSDRPTDVEQAIFALARLEKENSIDLIGTMLKRDSSIIVAAAIEAISKTIKENSLKMLGNYESCPNPIIRSAFYRALYYIKPENIHDYLRIFSNEKSPELNILSARLFSQIIPKEFLLEYLNSDKTNILIKITLDEALFAKEPFKPKWIKNIDNYESEYSNYALRMTNNDPEKIYLDINKVIDKVFFHKIGLIK